MKKVRFMIFSLLITGCCLNATQKITSEKAFNELTHVGIFTKKEPRATMLKKLNLRILKEFQSYLNDIITITTKYANSYKAALPEGAEKDSDGRSKTIAQTEEFKFFINELAQLSTNMKTSINKALTPLRKIKIDASQTKQFEEASSYMGQYYAKWQKDRIAQLELSLPEIQIAETFDMQMKLIQQAVNSAIQYFLNSMLQDYYQSIIDALKRLKVAINLPEQLNFDDLKKYYDVSTIQKTKRIKKTPEQVKQERKRYKRLLSE